VIGLIVVAWVRKTVSGRLIEIWANRFEDASDILPLLPPRWFVFVGLSG
jgi:hypothetical protein